MNWGMSLTMIGAIRLTGWITLGTIWGAANQETFLAWFVRRLLPKLRRGDIVVLDNAMAHKDPRVRRAARGRGKKVKVLPPYSPDFSPIEPAWALAKKQIKAVAPRDPRALPRIAHRAPKRIGRRHCRGWFAHCGFRCRLK